MVFVFLIWNRRSTQLIVLFLKILKIMLEKLISLFQFLYVNTQSRVRAYGEPSPEFTTGSDFRQGFYPSLFVYNFAIEMM